jgi:nucleoside-diphosphate-sugar epimerase
MHIVITGGAGFLGARLARTLLSLGRLALAGAPAQPIRRITLVDRAPPPADLAADPRITAITGDLNAQLAADANDTVWREAHAIFHLAAAVSGECEADFDLGMRSNFAATHALLERVRALGTKPVLVFSSSLAVFGDSPAQPLPTVIEDHTLPTPQTSYGIQKFIGEQLLADFTRKGFVRGRSVRLMTVSVRPGKPNGAASGFFSGMVREPLAGLPAACPVPDENTCRHCVTRANRRRDSSRRRSQRRRMGPAHRAEPAVARHHGRRHGRGAGARGRQGGHRPARPHARPGDPAHREDLARPLRDGARPGAGARGRREFRGGYSRLRP